MLVIPPGRRGTIPQALAGLPQQVGRPASMGSGVCRLACGRIKGWNSSSIDSMWVLQSASECPRSTRRRHATRPFPWHICPRPDAEEELTGPEM